MRKPTKFFVVSYTNVVKDYCDKQFFKRFNDVATGHLSLVVDNTPGRKYFDRICKLTPYAAHIDIPQEPKGSLFQRNVTNSVQFCREKFLESDCDVMVVLESDVIPPVDLLKCFAERIYNLEHVEQGLLPWGAIGGLYYKGFHDFSLEGLHEVGHVLSGCTVYSKALLTKYPFRFDPGNLTAFPDALICADAGGEFSLWNDHDIYCEHLEIQPGCRQSSSL